MLMLRLALMLALASVLLLIGAYLATRNKKYLTYLFSSIKYLVYFLAVMLVLFIISRVNR